MGTTESPAAQSTDNLGLDRQRGWLPVVPGYVPELNWLESVWSDVKGRELANVGATDRGEVAGECRKGLRRVQWNQQLGFGFLRSTGLFL